MEIKPQQLIEDAQKELDGIPAGDSTEQRLLRVVANIALAIYHKLDDELARRR